MKIAGRKRHSRKMMPFSLGVIALAIVAIIFVQRWGHHYPSTDDVTFEASVVHVAAAVGGRVTQIAVGDNDAVSKGDLLFQIDRTPYALAVAQAQADLDIAEGSGDSRQRSIKTEKSTARIAAEQVTRAQTNYALAKRTVERLRPLVPKGYVTKQSFDQALTAERDASTSLSQARKQAAASRNAVGTEQAANATIEARKAALAIARHALANTTVKATSNGRVVGLKVSAGEMVTPAQPLFTLIDTDRWYAVANFRETELGHIKVGECATVYSMIDRSHPIAGTVEGIGWAVLSTGAVGPSGAVPFVNHSLNWVHVAQRFPVRVRLEGPPPSLVRMGGSAVVEIGHGDGCK